MTCWLWIEPATFLAQAQFSLLFLLLAFLIVLKFSKQWVQGLCCHTSHCLRCALYATIKRSLCVMESWFAFTHESTNHLFNEKAFQQIPQALWFYNGSIVFSYAQLSENQWSRPFSVLPFVHRNLFFLKVADQTRPNRGHSRAQTSPILYWQSNHKVPNLLCY